MTNPVMVVLVVLVLVVVLGYDFFRPHAALNSKTSGEAAGIHMEGSDRVLTLLEAAA